MKVLLMTNGRSAGLPAFDVPSSVGKSLIDQGVAVALNSKKPQVDYDNLFSKWLHGTLVETEKDEFRKFQGSEGRETPIPASFRIPFLEKLEKVCPLLNTDSADRFKASRAHVVFTPTGVPKSWPVADSEAATTNTFSADEDTSSSKHKTLGGRKFNSGVLRISNDLLNDKAFNLDDWLTTKSAERFGNGINNALVNGIDDSGFPGFLKLEETEHFAYTAFKSGDLTKRLVFRDKPFYANANTLIRLGLQSNRAVELPSLQDGAVVTGDLEHLIIRIVTEMEMYRLTERYAEWGQTGFLMTMRWDAAFVGGKGDIQVWQDLDTKADPPQYHHRVLSDLPYDEMNPLHDRYVGHIEARKRNAPCLCSSPDSRELHCPYHGR